MKVDPAPSLRSPGASVARPLAAGVFVAAAVMASWSPVHAGVFEPKPLDDEAYGESYTAIADLDDGSYVLVQYVFTNAGFGDGKAACRALFVPKGKPGLNAAVRVGRDAWSYDAAAKTLSVDKCALSSKGGKTRFVARTDELTVDMTLGTAPRTTRPPGHRIKVGGGEFYEAEILVPWAKAKVRIEGKPGKVSATGMGFMDHTRSNTRLPKVASRWLRFRGFSGGTRVLLEVRHAPSGRATGWRWLQGKPAPAKLDLGDLVIEGGAKALTLRYGGHTLQTDALLYTYRPAKEWGMLGRMAKPWIGDPRTRTFRATLKGPGGTTVSGILEQAQITK